MQKKKKLPGLLQKEEAPGERRKIAGSKLLQSGMCAHQGIQGGQMSVLYTLNQLKLPFLLVGIQRNNTWTKLFLDALLF